MVAWALLLSEDIMVLLNLFLHYKIKRVKVLQQIRANSFILIIKSFKRDSISVVTDAKKLTVLMRKHKKRHSTPNTNNHNNEQETATTIQPTGCQNTVIPSRGQVSHPHTNVNHGRNSHRPNGLSNLSRHRRLVDSNNHPCSIPTRPVSVE